MKLQKIDELILKFEQGETSLAEEQELKIFFRQGIVPEKYRVYKDMFEFYTLAVQEEYPDPGFDDRFFENLGVHTGTKTRKLTPYGRYTWWGVAASMIILMGLYLTLFNQQKSIDTYENPEFAYAKTKKVLMMVSGNLNTGMDELSNIKELESGMSELKNIEAFNDGLKSMRKISTLDKTTNFIKQ
ncbi:MAG: hypothetical protein KQI35_11825 [Bacteroidetes bacterium]|nr:hypothetical protein [Bacteroidota bacterium]